MVKNFSDLLQEFGNNKPGVARAQTLGPALLPRTPAQPTLETSRPTLETSQPAQPNQVVTSQKKWGAGRHFDFG